MYKTYYSLIKTSLDINIKLCACFNSKQYSNIEIYYILEHYINKILVQAFAMRSLINYSRLVVVR